ncbi:MAG: fluoride efflux transporter FluC [Actinomycetota bacterium]
MTALAVGIAGALGATARAVAERTFARWRRADLPLALYGVNTAGSFVLGLLTGLALDARLSPECQAILGTGFCGAFTVVGPVTFDSIRLASLGRARLAATNLVVGTLLPLAAAALGLALA